jgi:predicted aspartyl protease
MQKARPGSGRKISGAFLLLCFWAGCDPAAPGRTDAPADPAAGEVAFRLVGPHDTALLVPVHLNGEGPFDFVFDTGATWTCLELAVAEQLGLEPAEGPEGVGIGVAGPARVRMVRLDSVRVGAASAIDIPACVLDLEHLRAVGAEVHGLVGLNFMKPFRVTLDFDREVLVLTED